MDPNTLLNSSDVGNCFTFTGIQISTFLTIINAFFAIIIGVIVAIVAVQQWRLSRAKFRLDLFDRRYEIYIKVKTFIANFIKKGFCSEDDETQFHRDTRDVKFFYGKEIANLKNKLYDLVLEHKRVEGLSKSEIMSPEKKNESGAKVYEIKGEIQKTLDDFDKKVNEYLNFEKWK